MPSTPPSILIQGPAGPLEVLAVPSDQPDAPLAVICHPHPLFGGTMQNKVVTTLARTYAECGAHTVRFNFRGVGQSVGTHDDGGGELDDLLAVVAWARIHYPSKQLWLAGFSFGGWIATKGALRLPAAQLVLIAPMVSRLSEEDVSNLSCRWILVQGERDEVIAPEDVFAWVNCLKRPPELICLPEAGHFFHGQLSVLREMLTAKIQGLSQGI